MHIADYTFWVEYNEKHNNKVIIHGWSNKSDLINLIQEPNAVTPSGRPMPKPCKRLPYSKFRNIPSFLDEIKQARTTGIYQIEANKIFHNVDNSDILENDSIGENYNNWVKEVIHRLLNSKSNIRITIFNTKNIISIMCENIETKQMGKVISFIPSNNNYIAREFFINLVKSIENMLSYI
ncbi:hypothetical protein ACFFHT_06595 [Gallibacterium melopsittaci]|uniref:Uncharacterized protein n=1 Tax=Gallibacterium melopsittaci TaxID=516063 RepID=A0ABV6HX60_9PAST